MANIIAVIWDCDKTLIDGYMQDPLFNKFHIDAQQFWEKEDAEFSAITKKKIRANYDTYYLNYFIKCAHEGILPGLNNAMLHDIGKEQRFYPGIPEILEQTKEMISDDKTYAEYGIQVEHYIVSTGFAETIRGSKLMQFVDGVWGCELLDAPDQNGQVLLSEIVYTIDNTTKTRAIFEINKGINKLKNIDVNSKIEKELRRVQFENMIYIADGPSDVPAFSVVKQNGGATFAVYPKGDVKAMRQVEKLRAEERVDMYAEADYSRNTTAYLWITSKIRDMANAIRDREQKRILDAASDVPKHLL